MSEKTVPVAFLNLFWKNKIASKKFEKMRVKVVNNGSDEIWKSAIDNVTKKPRSPDGSPLFVGEEGEIFEHLSGYGDLGIFKVKLDKKQEIAGGRTDFGFECKSLMPLDEAVPVPSEYIPGVLSLVDSKKLRGCTAVIEGLSKKQPNILLVNDSSQAVSGMVSIIFTGEDFLWNDYRIPAKAKTYDEAMEVAKKRLLEPPTLEVYKAFAEKIALNYMDYKGNKRAIEKAVQNIAQSKEVIRRMELDAKVLRPIEKELLALYGVLKKEKNATDKINNLNAYLAECVKWKTEIPKHTGQLKMLESALIKLKDTKEGIDIEKEYDTFKSLIESGILEQVCMKKGLLNIVTAPLVFSMERRKEKYFMGRMAIEIHDRLKCVEPSRDCRTAAIWPLSFKDYSVWRHPHMNGEGYINGPGKCRFGCLGSYQEPLYTLLANQRISEAVMMYVRYLTTDGGDDHRPFDSQSLSDDNRGILMAGLKDDSLAVYLESQKAMEEGCEKEGVGEPA